MQEIGEIILEVLLKAPGYLILRVVHPGSRSDPDGCLVTIVGSVFWFAVFAIWWLAAGE
jgi:hypothetical protein